MYGKGLVGEGIMNRGSFSPVRHITLAALLLFAGCHQQSANTALDNGAPPAPSTKLSKSEAKFGGLANTFANCNFQPTKESVSTAPGTPPSGMVWMLGGEFSMGANDPPEMNEVGMQATTDARPIHRVYVDGFYMDKTDVTNTQFAKFVRATGYVTVAERIPRAQDFPGAPP